LGRTSVAATMECLSAREPGYLIARVAEAGLEPATQRL
jgi:hypothetical protein